MDKNSFKIGKEIVQTCCPHVNQKSWNVSIYRFDFELFGYTLDRYLELAANENSAKAVLVWPDCRAVHVFNPGPDPSSWIWGCVRSHEYRSRSPYPRGFSKHASEKLSLHSLVESEANRWNQRVCGDNFGLLCCRHDNFPSKKKLVWYKEPE